MIKDAEYFAHAARDYCQRMEIDPEAIVPDQRNHSGRSGQYPECRQWQNIAYELRSFQAKLQALLSADEYARITRREILNQS